MGLVRRAVPIALAVLSACGGEPSPDSEPPRVTLTSPSPGVVHGSVPIVAEADDNVGIAQVQFLVDGAALGPPITAPPFEATWNADDAPNGLHTLTARASDAAFNEAVSPEVMVTVIDVGSLRVTTASSGFDIDNDGYRIIIDGSDAGVVGATASTVVSDAPAGPHTIGLADIAGNCALHLPRTRAATVTAGAEAGVDFAVSCSLASGPTAERILFSRPNLTPLGNGPEQVHAVNADGSGHVQLTDDQYNYVAMAWSPDRSTILFASDRLGLSTYSLYLMNADGTDVRPVNEAIRAGSASWSPDGTRFVYSDGTGIQTINPDGTNPMRLTSVTTDHDPAWSPDGGRIAFTRGARPQLHVMNVDGSDPHPISDGLGDESFPRWSPDGTRILYGGNRAQGQEVYVIQDDGTDRRNVTTNQENDHDGVWSPAGDRIVYATDLFPSTVLFSVHADGSGMPDSVLAGPAHYSAWR